MRLHPPSPLAPDLCPSLERLLLLLALVAVAGCRRPDARRPAVELATPAPDAGGGFLLLARGDTLAAEHYTRSPDHLRGQIAYGDGTRIAYDATIAADESIVRLDLRLWPPRAPLDSRPAEHSVAELHGPARDSLRRVTGEGRAARVYRALLPAGAQPYATPSIALAQQILRHARRLGGDGASIPILVLNGAATPRRVSVRWLPGDSAEIVVGKTRVRVGLDPRGNVLDGFDPALNMAVRRIGARRAPSSN